MSSVRHLLYFTSTSSAPQLAMWSGNVAPALEHNFRPCATSKKEAYKFLNFSLDDTHPR